MSTRWTPQQETALTARGCNLLLSASAGSGKTAVLTERIQRLVLDEKDPVDIHELLVLTFTNAAAGEMRSRVAASLSDALEAARREGAQEKASRLEQQIALLGSAQISTIDSFFQSLVRRYFYLIDLDPKTKIVSDANELYLLSQEVLSEVLETYYEAPTPDFEKLVALFAERYRDRALKETILSLYDFSCSMSFPLSWLAALPKAYALASDTTLSDLPWTKDILASFRMMAEQIRDTYRLMFTLVTADPGLKPYEEVLSEEYAFFSQLADTDTWDEWYERVGQAPSKILFKRLPTIKKGTVVNPVLCQQAKETIGKILRDTVKQQYKKEIESFFAVSPAQWMGDMRTMAPIVAVLSEITMAFAQALERRKRAEAIMDFSDMEHYALRILLDTDHPDFDESHAQDFPSETARALRSQYKEVMIDEYQDTNGVQELLTALLSNGKNRFMVGDLKQSIYRFRQADPTIFQEKYEKYSDNEDADSRRIVLNKNFRSDGAILSGINFIFRQIMTRDGLELDYGDGEALYAGRHEEPRPAHYVGGHITVNLIDQERVKGKETAAELRDMDGIAVEGRLIARQIEELIDGGASVMNSDGTYRPVTYDDIVILLRSVSSKGPVLLKELQEAGIPALSDREDDFVQNPEVRTLWELLKLLDNPRQDPALLAVLRTYFVDLKEEDFARLALARREQGVDTLWDILPHARAVLEEERAEKVEQFLAQYGIWRRLARRDGMAPLLRRILEDTEYMTYISGLPGGHFRKAHVEGFYAVALSRDMATNNGLGRFLDYLQETVRAGKEFRSVSSPTGSCAVRIMSIHRSKGLEFPIVFLADTRKGFNMTDLHRPVIMHRDYGLGIHHFDEKSLTRWPSLYWYAVRSAAERENRAEEARLLYVAMTRARDALYVSTLSKKVKDDLAAWTVSLSGVDTVQPLPLHMVANANSYADWLFPAMARHRSVETIWSLLERIPAFADDAPADHSAFRFHVVDQVDLLTAEEKEGLSEEVRQTLDENEANGGETEEVTDRENSRTYETVEEERTRFFHERGEIPSWMSARFSWQYAYPRATETPAKLTATSAVRLLRGEEYDEEIPIPSLSLVEKDTRWEIEEKDSAAENGEEESETSYRKPALPAGFDEEPSFLSKEERRFTGADYGTLIHKAMEVLDVTTLSPTREALETEIEALVEKGIFTEGEREHFLSRGRPTAMFYLVLQFLESSLAEELRQAHRVWKEVPFSVLLPAKQFYPHCEEGENVFLQGVMDCLVEKEGRFTIIDYKTDRVTSEEELRERYAKQLEIYKMATEQIWKRPVERLLLYSFTLGKEVSIPLE